MDQDPYSMNVPEPVPPASPTFNSNPIDGRSWIANARKALMNAIPNADTSTPSSSSTQQHVPMRPPQAPPPPGKPKSAKERPKVQTITYERYNMMKPALLEEMKSHIQRGLSSIEHNASDKDINDELTTRLRTLNVHREAFQKFIDECNIYRPVLSSIKHEYEKTLDFYSSNFDSVISLHAELASKNVEFKNETKHLNEDHAENMNTLVDQRLVAQKALNHSKKEQARVLKDHDEMKKMYEKMKYESEEAQTSISSLSVALTRAEVERVEALQQKADVEMEVLELKNSLSKVQDKNDRLRQQMQDLESVQSQMVSLDVVMTYMETIKSNKSAYKELETTHKAMIQRYADIKWALDHAFEKHAAVIMAGQTSIIPSEADKRDVQIDINEIKKDPIRMVEKMSEMGIQPRVMIESLLDCIDHLRKNGGGSGSGNGSRVGGMGSLQMGLSGADNRLKEDQITPEDTAFVSPWTHFEGLGLDESIPVYLRHNGLVQNIMLSKRDTEMIINDMWVAREEMVVDEEAKATAENKPINLMPFDQFFHKYILKRFKWKNRAVEFAYNFVDALKKFYRDSDVRLFSLVLNNKLNEEVRNDSIQMMVHFEDVLKKEEMMARSNESGTLTFDSFMRVLRRTFPTKGDLPLQRLERMLLFETNGTKTVKYVELLGEDENGNQGRFAELLRAQHLTEIENFSDEVMECIEQHRDGLGMLTVNRLREALEAADPNKSRAEINRLLSRGTALPVEDVLMTEARATLISVSEFKTRLKNGILKKSPPST